MSTLKFKSSGVNIEGKDASVAFTSDSVEWDYSHDWSVSFSGVGVDGSPVFTIQCSNDNLTWYDYDINSTDVSIANSFEWDYFGFKYQRVVYTPTGVTTGAVTAMYTVNNDNLSR